MRPSADEAANEVLTAALLALAQHGIPPDIQELLLAGDPTRGIAPGALRAALDAVEDALENLEILFNTCDVPGCGERVSAGWPSPDGYRWTCFRHSQLRESAA